MERRDIRRGRRSVPSVLLVTLFSLALACGAVLWWAAGRGKGVAQTPKVPRRTGRIADAATAAGASAASNDVARAARHGEQPSASTPAPVAEPSKAPDARPRKVIVNDGSCRPPDRYAVLPLDCDKKIAGLLYAEPGQLMIGTVDFGEEFERQFRESLRTRLTPRKDATDDEREIVEAVTDAKKAIVEAMKKEGKTAGEILSETRQQMRELGRYKEMIKQELRRYEADEEKTDQDVSDLFDAANRILKENGIELLTPNDLTREVVRQYKFDQQEGIEQ